MKPMFSPSLMCMDLLHVAEQIECLNDHVDMFHVDIMDGHYCRNITLSPGFANLVAEISGVPVDVHLMVTQPEDIIPLLKLRQGDYISVHAETIGTAAFRTLNAIREKGCRTGVVLNPSTGLEAVRQYLNRVDLLTIMTVDVGFAGQPFIPEMLDKIASAKELRERYDYHYLIQIDGSCNQKTYRRLSEAGADVYVVGSSGLFSLDSDLPEACRKMKHIFRKETE